MRRKLNGKQLTGRSRIINGSDLLPTVDARSTWARIMKDTIADMYSHLGGEDRVSAPSRMLSRRIGAFESELIFLEDKFARVRAEGQEPSHRDLDLYSRMSSAQRRMFETLGLERRQKDITGLSLGAVLREGLRHDREAADLDLEADEA